MEGIRTVSLLNAQGSFPMVAGDVHGMTAHTCITPFRTLPGTLLGKRKAIFFFQEEKIGQSKEEIFDSI